MSTRSDGEGMSTDTRQDTCACCAIPIERVIPEGQPTYWVHIGTGQYHCLVPGQIARPKGP